MPVAASRLFHTIVVLGASMGCASRPSESTPADAEAPPDAGDGSAGPSTIGPLSEGLLCQIVDAQRGPCGVCDCERPGTFRCTACASGTAPIDGRCPAGDGLGCLCDPSISIASPSDCAYPTQLVCDPPPTIDVPNRQSGWYAFARCRCDPTRPTTQSQCADERLTLLCASQWCPADAAAGAVSDVSYACSCIPAPVPIAVAP